MAGSDEIRAQCLGLLPERAKFNLPVTKHIRIRRAISLIFFYHFIHYSLFIFLLQVEKEKRDIERDGHSHGVAPFIPPGAGHERRLPSLDKDSRHVETPFLEQRGTHGRIDTSR